MSTRIRVEAVDGTHSASLTSLYRWFLRDAQLAAQSELSLVARQDPSAQGGLFDAVNAVIADGVGIGGLVLAYATWRQAHHASATIRFRRGDVTVEVTDASPETVYRLTEALSAETPTLTAKSPDRPKERDKPEEPEVPGEAS